MTDAEKIQKLKDALRIYAEESNWSHFYSQVGCKVWTWKGPQPPSERAREALSET